MSKQNATKKALVLSLLSLVLCVSMLVGSTFAWFTDTATTAVNKIVAGTLDVELLDESGNSLANDHALKWKTEDTGEVLWEPNCTYNLESFGIKNAGSLAFKYMVVLKATNITERDGKTLLDIIDWTLMLGEDTLKVTSEQIKEGLSDGIAVLTDRPLLPGETEKISVTAHMKAEAGNDYQGLSIGGFGITVVAAQYAYEYDSKGNEYDKDATYPIASDTGLSDALQGAEDGGTVEIASGEYALPGTSVSAGVTITGAGADKSVLKTGTQNYEFTGEGVIIKDITIDGTKVSSIDNNGAIKITGSNAVLDSVTLVGGGRNTYGHTARVDVKADTVTTIKNSTISGAFRGIQSFSLEGTLLIENTTLAPQCYCLNVDGGEGKIVVNNSVLMGWTSYTDSLESATFTDCTFEVNSNPGSYGYNCVRAYTKTTFVNCDFGDEFWLGAANNAVTVTFENCRFKGTLITADNVKDVLEPTDNANTTVIVK